MRMSDNVDTETMKVSEAAEPASSAKDAKTEVSDQSQNSRDEHGCNNKKDIQVKNADLCSTLKRVSNNSSISVWL